MSAQQMFYIWTSNEWMEGLEGDVAQILSGAAFFHLDFDSLGQRQQNSDGIEWTPAMKAFLPTAPLNTSKFHMSFTWPRF